MMTIGKTRTALALMLLLSLALATLWPIGVRGTAGAVFVPTADAARNRSLAQIGSGAFEPGTILVKFARRVPQGSVAEAPAHYGAVRIGSVDGMQVEIWRVPLGDELALVERLNADPTVEYAEPNYVYRALGTPNDPDFWRQWAHVKVQSPAAWDLATGSAGLILAVVDSGIDETHPDLVGKIASGWDYVDDDSNPHDLNGHGTHVAGIAAAVANNAVGVAGMDWQVRIMPVRVLAADGTGFTADIASGITYAFQHGAQVINLSLGGSTQSSVIQEAVNNAHRYGGSLVVAAMGNDGNDVPQYPAACHNVMAVAATTQADTRASYSAYGAHCDIAAPGGEMASYQDPAGIYSTMPTYPVYLTLPPYFYFQNYDYLDGTSMAAPFVAGLASLLWSIDSTLEPNEVQALLQGTAVDLGTVGWDQFYGAGRIDALAALRSLTPSGPTLHAIENQDGNGSYLVDWSDLRAAIAYALEEDDNSGFASPAVVYSGAASAFQISGRGSGFWFYRVRASNAAGTGPWSATRFAAVAPSTVKESSLPLLGKSFCTGSYGLPIHEGFEAGQVPPAGWSLVQSNPYGYTWGLLRDAVPGMAPYEGSEAAACDWDYEPQDEILLSPAFLACGATLEFHSFGSLEWCRGVPPNYLDNCDVNVWLVVGAWGGGDDVWVHEVDPDWKDEAVWSSTFINLTDYLPAGTPVRVGFRYNGTDGEVAGLDEVHITGY